MNPRTRPGLRPSIEALEERYLLSINKEVLAFYYPWYGNPQVSGQYVHWSGVDPVNHTIDNATHYPELGAYDSHDPAVVAQQVSWAVQSGVTGFISSWWGPGHSRTSRGAPSPFTRGRPRVNPAELPGFLGADLAFLAQQAKRHLEGRRWFPVSGRGLGPGSQDS